MANKIKISSQLPGIHNLKAQGNIPHPQTSPFVRLHQLQKNRERFLKELARLDRRTAQINKQVPAIEQELERLFRITEKEVQPSLAGETAEQAIIEKKAEGNSTVLEY